MKEIENIVSKTAAFSAPAVLLDPASRQSRSAAMAGPMKAYLGAVVEFASNWKRVLSAYALMQSA